MKLASTQHRKSEIMTNRLNYTQFFRVRISQKIKKTVSITRNELIKMD